MTALDGFMFWVGKLAAEFAFLILIIFVIFVAACVPLLFGIFQDFKRKIRK